jgi:predicted Rossmann-fold nucleotide-binding protein
VRIAVFLGSSLGPERHRELVGGLADGLVASGIGVVYGGARVGLMGLLADRVLARGG